VAVETTTWFEPDRLHPLVEGALDVRVGDDAIQPLRLPSATFDSCHPSLRDPFAAEAASGT